MIVILGEIMAAFSLPLTICTPVDVRSHHLMIIYIYVVSIYWRTTLGNHSINIRYTVDTIDYIVLHNSRSSIV